MLKKRIPTLIGLLLLLSGAFVGVLFIGNRTDFLPRAAPEYVPRKVKITNISDTGFTISWITQEPSIGLLRWGLNAAQLDTVVLDERDQISGQSGEYRTHYITVTGLQPTSTYYFKLGSAGKQLYDNNGQAFSLTTAPTITTVPAADTIHGSVGTSVDTPAEGAIVYVTAQDATPLSALVKNNGTWTLSLSTARKTDLSEYIVYNPQSTLLDILVQSDADTVTTARTTTGNDQPVPPITLGQAHDFTQTAQAETTPQINNPNPTPVPESRFSLDPIEVTDTPSDDIFGINNPAKDGAVVVSTQPELQGIAPKGAKLTITVHSAQIYTESINVDDTGAWNWTPPGELEPGEHTVTVSYNDEAGILHTINRTFIVYAAEDNLGPNYSATPSATPAPTTTPSPTTIVPTPSATRAPTPTITPRPTPTATDAALPVAATVHPTYIIAALGIVLLGLGISLRKISV